MTARRQASGWLSYAACFGLALLLHAAALVGGWPALTRPAGLAAEAGGAYVNVEFARPPRPAPLAAPPPQRLGPPPAVPEAPAAPEPPPVPEPASEPPLPLSSSGREPEQPAAAEEAPPAPAERPVQPVASGETAENAGADTAFAPPETAGTQTTYIVADSKPEYPRDCLLGLHRAERKACEGTAVFLVEALPDGHIGDIQLVTSAGCRHLDNSARRWLRSKARAVPEMRAGQPVRSEKLVEIRFRVKDYGY